MSNEVQVKKLTDIMAQFVGFTAKKLPDDVIAKLQELRDKEDSPMTKVIYDTMFRNQELALKLNRPSCQDTGVLQFWVKCGTKFPLIDNLEALLKDAVMQATVATPLRHNSVETFDEYNTGKNVGKGTPTVWWDIVPNSDKCEIYTDVDGVFTADPRVVKTAKKLDAVTYDEMLELASLGAKVLHNRSVEMAKKYNVELVVRSSLNRSEGTVVKEGANMEKLLVTGVAADKDTVRISVIGLEDKPGTAFAVFNTLAANNINVDIILQSVGREGTKDISFTVASDDLEHAIEVLNANKERLTIQDITWNEKVAKLSIVGAGMMSNPGVAAKMFESLYNSRVNINMISTSEIRITVLVPEEDIEKAMNAVHDGFGLGA